MDINRNFYNDFFKIFEESNIYDVCLGYMGKIVSKKVVFDLAKKYNMLEDDENLILSNINIYIKAMGLSINIIDNERNIYGCYVINSIDIKDGNYN